jgi:hypothetical protein
VPQNSFPCLNKKSVSDGKVLTDEILQEFHAWRMEQSAENQTFSFWDNLLYVDFMSYLGLYFSIRSRNWDLRNSFHQQN